jgi:hypothetical protein
MATSVYSWSTTAGTNASADSNINWAEGQLPSTVNDSARAMMAAIAAMLRDQGGYTATGGTTTAYTLALSQTMPAAVPALVGFRANATNTGACTLNVDGLGANPLRARTGVALAAGDIISGCNYVVTWNSSSSEWLLINPATINTIAGLGTGVATAAATAVNTNGGLLTAATAAIASGAIVTGAGSGTALTGTTPGTGVLTFLQTPSSANLKAALTDETGSGGAAVFATGPTITGLNLAAGSTSVAPINLTSGTNLTTATAGAVEWDGKTPYITPQGTQRGVLPGEQFYRLNSDLAGANSTSAQSVFGVGVTLSSSTVYKFEINLIFAKSAGTTSHSFSLLYGGTATLNNIMVQGANNIQASAYTPAGRCQKHINIEPGAENSFQFRPRQQRLNVSVGLAYLGRALETPGVVLEQGRQLLGHMALRADEGRLCCAVGVCFLQQAQRRA